MKENLKTVVITTITTVFILALAGIAKTGTLAQPNLGSGAPTVVSYQGQVILEGTPYDDDGYFKFAVVNEGGDYTYWSNDGSSEDGMEPETSVDLVVTKGLFNVLLGDDSIENMSEPLYPDVFADTERYLRVWFSDDGVSFLQLDPDRRITAVPYALQAQEALEAGNADTVDGYHGAALEESAEINADIDAHAAVADSHHARYTDGEAWAAVLANDGPGSGLSADNAPLLDRVTALTNNTVNVVATSDDYEYHSHTSVTIGVDGLGLISYGGYDGIYVAHCGDIACSFVTVTQLSSIVNSEGTSIVIGADGLGLVSFTYPSGLSVAHCDDVACSSATVYGVESAEGASSVTIGVDGLPLISYSYNGTLTVAHCKDAVCSDFDNYHLDFTNYFNGYYSSITIGIDGLGLISYYDEWGDRLKVAHCDNVACSSATLNVVGDGGMYTSITIGSDGLGLISHYDSVGDRLIVTHCLNTACTNSEYFVLDSDPDPNNLAGKYTSITIGDDGLGLISYFYELDPISPPRGKLMVAHCDDLACSQAALINVEGDVSMSVGHYTAVTIGADGLPLISYYEFNTHFNEVYLKAMHCASDFCTPFFRRR